MPGVIVTIKVNPVEVKRRDVLLTLEAMKMEMKYWLRETARQSDFRSAWSKRQSARTVG